MKKYKIKGKYKVNDEFFKINLKCLVLADDPEFSKDIEEFIMLILDDLKTEIKNKFEEEE